MVGVQYPHLHGLAKSIWQWAEQRCIFLVASYVKSKENVQADYLSRLENPDTEWSIAWETFNFIKSKLGDPEVDLFATRLNAKCSKYVSRFPERDALETDAFTISWENIFFYAFPPVAIIL